MSEAIETSFDMFDSSIPAPIIEQQEIIKQIDLNNWTKEAKIAWLACSLASEGNFTLSSGYRDGTGFRHTYWQPIIAITNTNAQYIQTVEQICKSFKFRITKRLQTRPDYEKGHKAVYRMRFKYVDCIPVINSVLPYMTIKYEQAGLLLEACKLLEYRKTRRRDKLLEEIYQQMKQLNKTGVQI